MPAPAALPQGVWRAADGAGARSGAACSTGHPALDRALPSRGWTPGLVELLSNTMGLLEALVLAPYWRSAEPMKPVGWVLPQSWPLIPYAPGWACAGLPPSHTLWVRTATAADAIWACERMLAHQAVHSVVWLGHEATTLQLRKVQWAAQQAGVAVFAARPWARQADASPAPVRLRLSAAGSHHVQVQVLKCPGPVPAQALRLEHPFPLVLPATGRRVGVVSTASLSADVSQPVQSAPVIRPDALLAR